ncbi:MAG: hypothetical protein PHE04_02330 [Bacteroidales bacterium]|nr:hypothetical protein [Bacteroidales bacterium]MDD3430573.1 hypothetical protein [Bacteroidales bacterium]MDD4361117.1 hypothetical protein [Bacteroidales bacterium]
MRRLSLGLTVAFLFLCTSSKAQELLYDLEVLSYFDNREYKVDFQRPQTILGMRIAPELGLGMTDENQGNHKLMLGLNYIQPLGKGIEEALVKPTVYYRYVNNRFRVNLGAVPFSYLIESLPDYLMYDSLVYMHPNMQGGLFQYVAPRGYVEFLCDWRSAQSLERYEAFRLILQARYQQEFLFGGGRIQLNHLANRARPAPRTGVSDDLIVHPYLGLDLSQLLPLDSIAIQTGYIVGYQRDRSVLEGIHLPQAFYMEFFARWKRFGLKNVLYAGDNLFPLYPVKGNLLNQGDPFYQAGFYNRTDAFVYLISTKRASCYLSFNFHYTRQGGLNHQQQLVLRFNPGNILPIEKSMTALGK